MPGRDLGALNDKLKGCYIVNSDLTTNNDSISVFSPSALMKYPETAESMITSFGIEFDDVVYRYLTTSLEKKDITVKKQL